MPEKSVLSNRFTAGPHGVGDPDDKFLRKVEKDVLIPKIMRERARKEKCTEVVADFEKCCKASGLSMVYKCRAENTALKECLTKWYQDEDYVQECTEIYLNERADFRRTGKSKKQREEEAALHNENSINQ